MILTPSKSRCCTPRKKWIKFVVSANPFLSSQYIFGGKERRNLLSPFIWTLRSPYLQWILPRVRPCNEGLSKTWTNFAWAFAYISTRNFSSENKWINFKTRTLDSEITSFEVGLDGIQMLTELTMTLTSNLPQELVLTSQNVSTVSFLVVKLRKTDSQFMWERLVSLSWATFISFLKRSYQGLNVARSNDLIWIIISDWIFLLHVPMYCARTRVDYHMHFSELGLVRVINISNKFFEKILGEWTICKAEKSVIKSGEKGKRKETNWQSRTCSRKRLLSSQKL